MSAGADPGRDPGSGPASPTEPGAVALPAKLMRRVIAGLPTGLVVLDATDRVVLVNSVAQRMGVVAADEIAVSEMAELVAATRVDGNDHEREIELPPLPEPPLTRPRPDQEGLAVRARARLLDSSGHVAVILDDITEFRRVEAVRRDFVANVSHELKTPVGALHILAEAVAAASEDPTAVRRFAARMTHQSTRLTRLVQEIIDLSRLQGADPLPDLRPLPVSAVLAEAVDRTRFAAQAQAISVAVIGADDLRVCGDEGQLVTAIANLLDNAISYSPRGTRVGLGVRRSGETVEISVTDEGIGIAEKDLERVFERFYRSDPARSRATGGTGLGLAIVKHIATNHGGVVSVWSAEGAGSTFTLRLPLHHEDDDAVRPGRTRTGGGHDSNSRAGQAPASAPGSQPEHGSKPEPGSQPGAGDPAEVVVADGDGDRGPGAGGHSRGGGRDAVDAAGAGRGGTGADEAGADEAGATDVGADAGDVGARDAGARDAGVRGAGAGAGAGGTGGGRADAMGGAGARAVISGRGGAIGFVAGFGRRSGSPGPSDGTGE